MLPICLAIGTQVAQKQNYTLVPTNSTEQSLPGGRNKRALQNAVRLPRATEVSQEIFVFPVGGAAQVALDPPVPTATILLARVQNAVPAFDHGARLANNAVARRVVSPAAVAAIVIKTGAVPVPVPVRARR